MATQSRSRSRTPMYRQVQRSARGSRSRFSARGFQARSRKSRCTTHAATRSEINVAHVRRSSASGILAMVLLASCAGQRAAPATSAAVTSATSAASPIAASPTPSPTQRMETPLPAALEESAAAAAGGKLYVIGGFEAAGNSLSTVWVFDGTAWSAGPRLPLGLDHVSAATLDDQVYVAGGHTFGRDRARFFRPAGGS